MQGITRHIITGVLTVIPLFVTVWIVWFVVDLLIWLGRPGTFALSGMLRPTYPEVADILLETWFQSALALLIALLFLFILGRVANAVVGRRVLQSFDRVVESVPLARTIYSATQTLIRSLGGDGKPTGQRVVLIEFPSENMRAVGLSLACFPRATIIPNLLRSMSRQPRIPRRALLRSFQRHALHGSTGRRTTQWRSSCRAGPWRPTMFP